MLNLNLDVQKSLSKPGVLCCEMQEASQEPLTSKVPGDPSSRVLLQIVVWGTLPLSKVSGIERSTAFTALRCEGAK